MAHMGTEEMSCAFPCSLFFPCTKSQCMEGNTETVGGALPMGTRLMTRKHSALM